MTTDDLAGYTDEQIRFRARNAAIVYLAVERGWQPTASLYTVARSDITLAAGLPEQRLHHEPPPLPSNDLRAMVITRHPDRVEIAVIARLTGDRWTPLMMDLHPHGRRLEVQAAARADEFPQHLRELQQLRMLPEDDPDYRPPPAPLPQPQPPQPLAIALRDRLRAVQSDIQLIEGALRVRDSELAATERRLTERGDIRTLPGNEWAPRLEQLDAEAFDLETRIADVERSVQLDSFSAAAKLLGERPTDTHAADVWNAAAVELTEYRIRYGITDPDLAYGQPVTAAEDPVHAAERSHIIARLTDYHDYLADLEAERHPQPLVEAGIDI